MEFHKPDPEPLPTSRLARNRRTSLHHMKDVINWAEYDLYHSSHMAVAIRGALTGVPFIW